MKSGFVFCTMAGHIALNESNIGGQSFRRFAIVQHLHPVDAGRLVFL